MARYVRLVFRTSNRNEDYSQLADSFAQNAPLIIGGWHGTFLLAPVLLPNPEKFSAVVARHGDAELMGLMLERFGVKLIRGAGAGGRKANKGGVFALRMSLRELKAGRSIAMTADVPPGSIAPRWDWHHHHCPAVRSPHRACCSGHITFQGAQ